MLRLRYFSIQMLLSHVAVTLITSVVLVTFVVAVLAFSISPDDYRVRAMLDYTAWQFDDRQIIETFSFDPEGFTIITEDDGEIVYVDGDTVCGDSDVTSGCASELFDIEPSVEPFKRDGATWTQVVLTSKSGHTIYSQRGPYTPGLNFGETTIFGLGPIIATQIAVSTVIVLPVALLFSFLIVRPQVRRIASIAATSRRFAAGELSVRIRDQRFDEIGQLAQQFDDMADSIQHNLQALRELAQENAALAQQVESVAQQQERVRLSRDLHDTIAQKLFSLSMNSASLPELIAQDSQRGIEGARTVSKMAEDTLADLRTILVDLRAASPEPLALADALQAAIKQWQVDNQIEVTRSFVFSSGEVPSVVQDVLLKVSQEALANVTKHAEATAVAITIVEVSQQIDLSITDNGRGFDTKVAHAETHIGLSSMRERAATVGGSLTIESSEAGTSIQLSIPLAGK